MVFGNLSQDFCGNPELGPATTKTVLKSIHCVIITIPFVHGPGAGCSKNRTYICDTNSLPFSFFFFHKILDWSGLLRADCSVQVEERFPTLNFKFNSSFLFLVASAIPDRALRRT